MGDDTDLTPVPQIDADTDVMAFPPFEDDPTPPAGAGFDDTAPVVIDPRPTTERRWPPGGRPPTIGFHAPRRAAVYRAVKRPDTKS